MTQEESLRDILNFILANPFDVHLIEEKAKLAMKLIDDNEQPIPQDLSKWIEDEAEKIFPTPTDDEILFSQFYNENGKKNKQFWKIGANATAQLLLPQLQQLREQSKIFEKGFDGMKVVCDAQRKEIEQQKSQIGKLGKELKIEMDKTWALQEIERQQAAKIQALKQEILRLKEQHNKWAKIYNDRLDNQP